MLTAYPNPAKDQLTLQLNNTEILELFPESITLVDELTGSEALSVPVNDIFQKKQFQDGNKLLLDVNSLRRGICYLNVVSKPNSNQKSEKILLFLERGASQRTIEKEVKISRKTIATYLLKFQQTGCDFKALLSLTDQELDKMLGLVKTVIPRDTDPRKGHFDALLEYFTHELRRTGVTRLPD